MEGKKGAPIVFTSGLNTGSAAPLFHRQSRAMQGNLQDLPWAAASWGEQSKDPHVKETLHVDVLWAGCTLARFLIFQPPPRLPVCWVSDLLSCNLVPSWCLLEFLFCGFRIIHPSYPPFQPERRFLSFSRNPRQQPSGCDCTAQLEVACLIPAAAAPSRWGRNARTLLFLHHSVWCWHAEVFFIKLRIMGQPLRGQRLIGCLG